MTTPARRTGHTKSGTFTSARQATEITNSKEQGILDTNTVILLSQISDPSVLPGESMITAVTLAELSAGPLVAADESEQARRQAILQQAEADFDPLPFNDAAARTFGRVAANLRAAGRKPAARAYDALIAATAIANGLPLYTTNPDDFAAIDELELVAVPHPNQSVKN
ncbi:MAG: type II toxin-antitoxin system VapC family toxin [Acidimicrobiaceae bacterium]|nr:type II toxin-antitoxin system VapC family toxin [Acidimicrobiaceae bacterium]